MFQTTFEFIVDTAQVTDRVYHLIYRVRRVPAWLGKLTVVN